LKKTLRRIGAAIFGLAAVLAIGAYTYLQHPKFGSLPEGARLQAIERSPNYRDGIFQNQIDTPMRTQESAGFVKNIWSLLVDRNPNLKPPVPLSSTRIDLKALAPNEDVVVWLGHSSYYVQLGGKKLLIDPVFSISAAPIAFANDAFAGTTPYTADDMPAVDYLLLSHDHWDHLDYPSVTALQGKVGQVVTGLGMGQYFEQWGYTRAQINELDWNGSVGDDTSLRIHVLTARHYSGRMLTRHKTLWVAFALQTPQRKLFFSGDSGYGPHFREIGERFGGFDMVALDSGQYDKRWANIHMFPEQAAQAAEDLRAKALLPAHIGRFSIAAHDWDEPFKRVSAAAADKPYRLLTPGIGAVVRVGDETQRFSPWWTMPGR
jgi:L-ascorbate metabolism protein UlaG (beta-lactamase superfamily)